MCPGPNCMEKSRNPVDLLDLMGRIEKMAGREESEGKWEPGQEDLENLAWPGSIFLFSFFVSFLFHFSCFYLFI